MTSTYLDLIDGFENWGLAAKQVSRRLEHFSQLVWDRAEDCYVQLQGQWPDKFILLNRYIRTGLRPPFMFND